MKPKGKPKTINIQPNTKRVLSVMAAQQDTNLKVFIEMQLDAIAYQYEQRQKASGNELGQWEAYAKGQQHGL